jgi:hypothetical protein
VGVWEDEIGARANYSTIFYASKSLLTFFFLDASGVRTLKLKSIKKLKIHFNLG